MPFQFITETSVFDRDAGRVQKRYATVTESAPSRLRFDARYGVASRSPSVVIVSHVGRWLHRDIYALGERGHQSRLHSRDCVIF